MPFTSALWTFLCDIMEKSREISQSVRKGIVFFHKSGSYVQHSDVWRCHIHLFKLTFKHLAIMISICWKKKNIFKLGNSNPNIKYRGGNILFGVELHKINGILWKEHWEKILKQDFKAPTRKLKLEKNWVFQMDNNPNYTAKLLPQGKSMP